MSKIKFLFLSALLSSWVTGANAQITVDDTPTAADLVINTLMGNGVAVSNITFVGQNSQKGEFSAGSSNIGLASGIMLSTGDVASAVPPAVPSTGFGGPGDADVLATAISVTSNPESGNITTSADAAVLEFDFIPDGNTVTFNFVFASEEYTTWINSVYNDAFGFYLTGPNPAGGNYMNQNLALVPGTNAPITISTIYVEPTETPPSMNGQYYIGSPVGHSFNGFSVPIEITFDVECGETYHFKFAVADCGQFDDDILDTAVFLEEGSFTSTPVEIDFLTSTQDTVVYEGCDQLSDIIFSRPGCQTIDTLIVDVDISGTATNGVDYTMLDDTLIFLPGVDTLIWQLDLFADGIVEGPESIEFTLTAIASNGDTVVTTGIIWINEPDEIEIIGTDIELFCFADSADISAAASGGFVPYSYEWDTGDTTTQISVFIPGNGVTDYYVTVTDACGYQDTDTVTVTMNQTLAIDTMIQFPSNACFPSGVVSGTAEGVTAVIGQPYYNWTGPDTIPGIYSIDGTVLQDIPPGWYYFTVEDDVCSVMDSIFVEVEEPPVSQFSASPSSGCEPLTVTFTNSSQNTTDYYWDFGNGNTLNIGDESSQTQVYTSPTTVMLVAFADPSCSDTSYVSIAISVCGCTDPTALNYNPNATVDDGECEFPSPAVIVPNVFTPNGDLNNPLFILTTENTVRLKLTILNRWGNVMYSADTDLTQFGAIVGWDGRTPAGQEAQEGTYFYEYVATGIKGDVLEGHGFLELVRD